MSFAARSLMALALAAWAQPALAAQEPRTRLVDCGAESCLLVSGTRADAGAAVSINGHPVAAAGGRKWRAKVPVRTLRDWAEPYARTITVAVAGTSDEVDLPIGMLGRDENLAMLVVRMK